MLAGSLLPQPCLSRSVFCNVLLYTSVLRFEKPLLHFKLGRRKKLLPMATERYLQKVSSAPLLSAYAERSAMPSRVRHELILVAFLSKARPYTIVNLFLLLEISSRSVLSDKCTSTRCTVALRSLLWYWNTQQEWQNNLCTRLLFVARFDFRRQHLDVRTTVFSTCTARQIYNTVHCASRSRFFQSWVSVI